MTKRELIKALEGIDDDTCIIVLDQDNVSWSNIDRIIPDNESNSSAAIAIGGNANDTFNDE